MGTCKARCRAGCIHQAGSACAAPGQPLLGRLCRPPGRVEGAAGGALPAGARCPRPAAPPSSARLTLVLLKITHALLQGGVVSEVDVVAGAVGPKGVELAGAHQAQLPHIEGRGAARQRACDKGPAPEALRTGGQDSPWSGG